MPRTIAHIVNPVNAPPSSDLHVAQPITFETMRQARDHARGTVAVRLLAAQYPEDRAIVPEGFEATPDLDRSVLDLGTFGRPRKLPPLADVLQRLHDAATDADYLIYTNVDIALRPEFYVDVNRLISDGYDAFVINRRTVSASHVSVEDIPMMLAEAGEPHSGHDCFVFPREVLGRYVLGDACLGVAGVGRVLLLNLACHAERFTEFKDLHLTFHIGDDKVWKNEEYADYAEFGRGQVDSVVETLERTFGPITAIPAAAPYLPHWRREASSSKTGPRVRPITAMKRLWGALRGRLNRE